MAVRATISKGYIWRPAVMGAMGLVFCGLFLYDGFIKYPHQEVMWGVYNQIRVKYEKDPNEAQRIWEQTARDKGWPITKPIERAKKNILTQKIMAAASAPFGLYFAFAFLSCLGRWVEADEEGLRTRSGQRVPYGAIKSIDKSRWERKGIAVVHYEADGRAGRITLDDWKYDREPTKRILQAIEDRMPGGGDDPGEGDTNGIPGSQGEAEVTLQRTATEEIEIDPPDKDA
jgi:hypothetical protein